VPADPEVVKCALLDSDEFVLLACDGLWDVSVLQCVVVHCSVLQMCRSVLQCVAVFCSVL